LLSAIQFPVNSDFIFYGEHRSWLLATIKQTTTSREMNNDVTR